MRQTTAFQQGSTLRDYLQVVRRRKWIIIAAVVVAPVVAYALSTQTPVRYQASAQVLLAQDSTSQLLQTQATPTVGSGQISVGDQAVLARVPAVARRVVRALHGQLSVGAVLAQTSVSTAPGSSILTFYATTGDPGSAERLATAYANAYVGYRFAAATASIELARKQLDTELATTPAGSLHDQLVEKDQTLQELTALRSGDASVVRAADGAATLGQQKKRDVALGLILGLIVGVALALLREALDTRVRSADAIGSRLELPLLARLPAPPRKLAAEGRLVMLDEPMGVQAEAFRMLRTNLEFASLGRQGHTVMVTSAMEQEGKSTTIANLAIAQARSGRHVILVDLDLRRPFLDRFFGLSDHAGITQVALGHVTLDEALTSVPLVPMRHARNHSATVVTSGGQVKIATNGSGDAAADVGSLHVLVSGPIPPDPGEFVGTARLTEILEELGNRADTVLIDAPPLFHVGDALTLSAKVDAVVVVTRMEVLRRPILSELKRLLDTMPAVKLGFVVTSAEAEDGYGAGYAGYYSQAYSQRDYDKLWT